MKKIISLTLIFLLVNIWQVAAETTTIYATRYKLRIYNSSQDAGAKYDPDNETAVPAGMYERPSSYDAEILCDFDLSFIPSDAVVNSVDFEYYVSSMTAGTHAMKIYENNQSWFGIPQYNDFASSPWPSGDMLVSNTVNSIGWKSFTNNSIFKSLIENWLSNSSSNKGLIITNSPSYYDYYINITRVKLVIDYTAINNPPTNISLSNTNVEEGQDIGTEIGTFSTTDPDAGDSHTYSLVSGIGAEDNLSFTIEGITLKTNEVFNYNVKSSYSIRVRTTDNGDGNLWFEKQYTITVNELEDYSEWGYSLTIYFNTTTTGADITGNVTDFPVLVRLNSTNFDFSQAQDNGEDIRFEDSDGTQLTYEIEEWINGQQKASVWVNVPLVHGNSDQDYIIMHYGKSTATDKSDGTKVFTTDNGFVGVWHLSENHEGTGTADLYKDATVNNSHGDDYISATGKDGIIGDGQEFDGYNDFIDVPDFSDSDIDNLTISVWIKPKNQSSWHDIISKEDGNYDNAGFGLRRSQYDQFVFTMKNSGRQQLYGSETAFTDNGTIWYLVSGTYDGSTQRIYINGIEKKSAGGQSGAIIGTSQNLNIGRRVSYADRYIYGYIDEVRIETVARSADWIKLGYENQKQNQTFITYIQGQPEVAPPSNFTASTIGGTSILLTWQDNSNNEIGFELSYGPDLGSLQFLVDASANEESYTHSIGTCGESYLYAIKAYNATNESPLVVLDQQAYSEPCVPENLQAVQVSASEMAVSWDGSAPQYVLEFSISGLNDWALLNSGTAKAYNHQGLQCNTAYDYRVKAVNPTGESNWTAVVTATTDQCILEAPTNLTADNSIPDKILLNWTDNSSTEDGFKIFRKEVSEASYTEIGTVGFDITVFSDESVVCNTTYKYYVVAYNASFSSGASNNVEVTTLYCGADRKTSELIRVTGIALNPDDTPVNGTKIVVVHLYNSKESSAVPIYDETVSDVEVRNGFVSVPIGYGDNFKETITNNNTLYYDIIVDGVSIFDNVLQNLTASPYTIKNTFNLHGAGSPMGTVSGPVGASYVDTNNLKLYMKYGETDNDWQLIGQ